MDTSVEVGDIFRTFGSAYLLKYGQHLSLRHHRAIRALSICRTQALGGHIAQCDQRPHHPEKSAYNTQKTATTIQLCDCDSCELR